MSSTNKPLAAYAYQTPGGERPGGVRRVKTRLGKVAVIALACVVIVSVYEKKINMLTRIKPQYLKKLETKTLH